MKNKAIKGGIAGVIIAAIITFANVNIGQQEKPNNSGFKNPIFEKAMYGVGFHKYDSWCVYFAKLCWYIGISNDTVRDLAMKLIVGNSQNTLYNFQHDKSGWFEITNYPQLGAIVIWQEYKDSIPKWSGHAGVVDSIFAKGGKYDWHDVEGNTNNNGSANGFEVLGKYRRYNWNVQNGLRIKAFIRFRVKK